MSLNLLSFSSLVLAAMGLTTSCDNLFSDNQYDFSGIVLGQVSQGSAATSADAHRLEVPKLQEGILFLAHSSVYDGDSIMTYCVGYDTLRHHSQWVGFRFDAVTRQQNVSRSNEPFMDDPLLPAAYYIGYNGFGNTYFDLNEDERPASSLQPTYGSGFDRGHLCASADRYLSAKANEQTFYMTNMSPQLSAFNQRYWTAYESFVQARGRDKTFADTLYVVKGGTIRDGEIIGHIKRNNGTTVVIPAYYYMALLYCKNNTYGAIAFYMEHKDYGVKNSDDVTLQDLLDHALSIDQLEERTGIDFFSNLPDAIENEVEKGFVASDWKL